MPLCRLLSFACLLLIACCSLCLGQDTTCGIIWDEPIILSDTTRDAHSPKIALSGDDTVHITWVNGGFSNIRLPYVLSTNGGVVFSNRMELLADSINYPGRASWTQIISSGSNVYVFFIGSTAGNTPIRMLKSTNRGVDWIGPLNISSDTTGIIQSVGIQGDTIAIIYPGPFSERRILRSSDGGASWTRSENPVNVNSGIAIGSHAIHLLQLEDTTGDTEYRRSSDLGDTWSPRTFLSTLDGFSSGDPAIAANGSFVMTAWLDIKYGCIGLAGCSIIGRIGFADRETTMFYPERVLTDFPAGYDPSLSVRGNRMGAAWPMDREQHPRAQVRVSYDTTWCSTFDPSTGIATRGVIAVRVAISSKAVHVVWEASQAPSPSTFRIFYRRGRFIETAVHDNQEIPLASLSLRQNYPNPFNPSTTIAYALNRREFVRLAIHDVLGREVAILLEEYKEPGEHNVTWEAEGMPAGVYYYRLMAGSGTQIRKAILLR